MVQNRGEISRAWNGVPRARVATSPRWTQPSRITRWAASCSCDIR